MQNLVSWHPLPLDSDLRARAEPSANFGQYALKRPHAISFSRKNDIHPFEDAASLEFFASKNDASLFLTGLHSKKRPHDLIFARVFDGKVLDMIELGIEEVKSMSDVQVSRRERESSVPSPDIQPRGFATSGTDE